MNQPPVSVVIPNYNYGRFLPEAIDSVLTQTYQNIEIIVVDDGSTDNSLEILAGYEKKGIKVIRQKNSGVGAARNNGVKNSTGKLIAFLDADDIWRPQKIEKQITRLLADREFGLVACAVREFDTEGNTIYGDSHTKGKEGWCAEDILLFKPAAPHGPAVTALIWREMFEKAGGFDERKEMHPLEDWEFLYRIARIAKIAFISEPLVEYRNHGGNGHLNAARFERALLLGYEKIFQSADEKTLKLRRLCYGNLYKMVAGAYFHNRQYAGFLKNTGKSLIFTPENLVYFASFPIRRLSGHNKQKNEGK